MDMLIVIILPYDYCRSCYWSSLELCRQNDLRTLAFPCISTGAYHYPSVEAADVAIATVRAWLLGDPMNLESIDRIVFVTRRLCDEECYATLMLTYLPLVWYIQLLDIIHWHTNLIFTSNILFITHNCTQHTSWFWQQSFFYCANHCW